MFTKWALSKFYVDEDKNLRPVATAYGMRWRVPMYPHNPENGWALVEIYTTPMKIDASTADPRVIFLKGKYSVLPQQVVDTYAQYGATAGMSLGELLERLEDVEPIFAEEMKV